MASVSLICLDSKRTAKGSALAHALGLEFNPVSRYVPTQNKRDTRRFYTELLKGRTAVLLLDNAGLSLLVGNPTEPLLIKPDFCDASLQYRLAQGGGRNEMIAKAVGLKGQSNPSVLDCTAGLGIDAFVLAALGCEVTLLERNPIVHALLEDALERACSAEDLEVSSAVRRMQLLKPMDATVYLQNDKGAEKASVIYLDPMFPPRGKSAQVKKTMQAFHALVGDDADSGQLLPLALQAAGNRVVVKRPRHAPLLNDQSVSHTLEGQRNRYDIYLKAGSASAG